MSRSMDEKLIRQLKSRVEAELRQQETALVEYWLAELKKIEDRRHQDLAGILTDLKALINRMQNRLKTLRAGPRR